ncbi:class II aaRS and biotin synthetase [Lophiostoma macrostomum CBS 122681]|uniref:threonine--tRNA ligase n=1 Tax=Lophiostoma macrostomum CBS 122681 TaxID=1314788 RepID=A0A6A6TVH8_9PLEO|nr:class II aaRS and biotin synthetase [Lophiostoma macrostomum CBS 122681]
MLSPRPLSSYARAVRCAQLASRFPSRHVKIPIRSCSCSTPQKLQSSVSSSQASNVGAQLNPTTTDLPTPSLDHRTLAQKHDLFITSPYSPGSPLLLPNGTYIFEKLQAFLRAQYPIFGFREVITPTIYKKSLWEKSGHWENYAEDMFSVQGRGATGQTEDAQVGQDEEFGLKPMNCPGHCLLFGDATKTYRDLPVRYADFSALHRNEISGALSGLTRVRRFHQDDAHIFCRPDQILEEIEQTLKFVGMVYDTFGLGPYKLLLSTRPDQHFIGTPEEWDQAEEQLKSALNNSGRQWDINPGDGAFYGPKIDIILKDANGKEHQTATIQLDFQLPQRFDLQYQASPEELEANTPQRQGETLDSANRRPVIIHRAIYGSLERFMALLIEHYAGTYPFWLSPRPSIILSVNQDPAVLARVSYLQSFLSGMDHLEPRHSDPENTAPSSSAVPPKLRPRSLFGVHLPIDVDTSARPLGKKLAEARTKKYNHIIVIGPRDVDDEEGRISVELVNQPNIDAVKEVLRKVLGKDIEALELTRLTPRMSAKNARRYFKSLVYDYL